MLLKVDPSLLKVGLQKNVPKNPHPTLLQYVWDIYDAFYDISITILYVPNDDLNKTIHPPSKYEKVSNIKIPIYYPLQKDTS